jgi:hypothetical protein
MAGTGIHLLAKLRAQILRFETIGITPWQTAMCNAPCSGNKENMRPGLAFGNPQYGQFICGNLQSKHRGLLRSAVHIWTQRLASEWNPAPAILNWESPCSMCHYFLTVDFSGVKLICDRLFRPKPTTNCLSWHTSSWHYIFNSSEGLN